MVGFLAGAGHGAPTRLPTLAGRWTEVTRGQAGVCLMTRFTSVTPNLITFAERVAA